MVGKGGSEREVVGQAGQGSKAMERARDCEAVGRAGRRYSEAASRVRLVGVSTHLI